MIRSSEERNGRLHLVVITGDPDTCEKEKEAAQHFGQGRAQIRERALRKQGQLDSRFLTLSVALAFKDADQQLWARVRKSPEYARHPQVVLVARDARTLAGIPKAVAALSAGTSEGRWKACQDLIQLLGIQEDTAGKWRVESDRDCLAPK
jgi:hypothetical protein